MTFAPGGKAGCVLRLAKMELNGEKKRREKKNRISTLISSSLKLQYRGTSVLCLHLLPLPLFTEEFRKRSLCIYSTNFFYLLSNPVKGKKESALPSGVLLCVLHSNAEINKQPW